MNTQEIADRFYQLAQENKWNEIQDELYSKNAKSIEPAGAQTLPSVEGIDKIREKGKAWESMIQEVHGGYCGAPQVAGNYFVCTMGFDATFKGQGRSKMDEVALYKVEDGKIVSEQFFF
jgi:hypothetical protein